MRFVSVLAASWLFLGVGIPGAQNKVASTPQTTAPTRPRRIRMAGGEMARKLVHQVVPSYPPEAMVDKLKGSVRLQIVVGCDGKVVESKILSGNAVLAKAATKAVEQWRYEPTLVNKQPVQVITDIELKFDYHHQGKQRTEPIS